MLLIFVLISLTASSKVFRIPVQEQPGSLRAPYERAHYASRMEFMSKLSSLRHHNNSDTNSELAFTTTQSAPDSQNTDIPSIPGLDKRENSSPSKYSLRNGDNDAHISLLDRLSSEIIQKRAFVGVAPVRGNSLDTEWVAAVVIGTPSQEFSVVLDTGSSDLWVSSISCRTLTCLNLRRFVPSRSRSFRETSQPWSITYADSSQVSGIVGSDDITVAGITVLNQTFGLATVNTGGTASAGVDGILGLGFDSNAEISGANTVITNMIANGQIDESIVSVWLNKAVDQDPESTYGGQFIFGGVDDSLFTGSITYVNVTSTKNWEINVKSVSFGDKDLPAPSNAIVDTGSSYILFPDYLATAFHRAIPKSQFDNRLGWLIPCSLANSRTVGDLTFELGGEKFSVPISDIVILKSAYNGYCLSAVDSWSDLAGHGDQGVSAGSL
ncbi:hypothetical protein BGZ76_010971 [Entomortierella beljakovae]|nr:hypothetical protein BGZ76_010971 [Entomortierella beljakovae]